MISFNMIKDLCKLELVHDCAFFYDFEICFKQEEHGILNAFRAGAASTWTCLSDSNYNISYGCKTRDE